MSAPVRQPGDHSERSRLLDDLDSTFVVEAAAGTGKTTVLVERVVALVRRGRARLSEIIAVTFTEKAAGEMKLRLRTRLEKVRTAATVDVERQRLTDALEELEIMRIGTIHGLCADFLRENPVEAGIDPLFEVASEGEAHALLEVAFARQFQELLQSLPEGVRRALRRRQRGKDAQPPRAQLLNAVEGLVERRDFATPWRREPFDRDAAIDAVLGQVEAFGNRRTQLVPRKPSEFVDVVDQCARFMSDLRHREQVAPRDHDGLEASLRELGAARFKWEKRPWGVSFQGVSEAEVVAERDALFHALQRFSRLADADLAARLHEELSPVVVAYGQEKHRAGVLDFVDLLLLTRNLLRDHRGVREKLQQSVKHLFVDEFQDTDPLQSEIVLLLAADDPSVTDPFATRPVPGKIFLVGDPKQSIYRFRRADILLYERVKAHLVRHGAQVAYLTTSFRGTPGIQAAVNHAFATAMVGPHQATWKALGEWREPNKEQPSVVVIPAPSPLNDRGNATKDHVERSLPAAVGAFIEWLTTKSGWEIEEEGKRVPLEARHVCILFKRQLRFGTDITRPYAQALEARRVPHVLVGGHSFHEREEIIAARVALFAVDRPDDEYSVYATLRGPFFALTDEQLFAFKAARGKLHPLRPFEDLKDLTADDQAVIDALGVLGGLHRERNKRPVASTIHALLEATRAHAGIAVSTGGAQALANVLQLAEVTRGWERRATSFRQVIEALQEQAEEGGAPEAPIVEEGTDGVRMMTVHAAKGLEFPVVILAEPTANSTWREPTHWVDPERSLWVHAVAGCLPAELREHEAEVLERDHEEAVRLAYVAATRARDLLVVPACSDRRFEDTWTEPLYPSIYPSREKAHSPRAAPKCPPFGRDVILKREGMVPPEVPLPGLHTAEHGKNGVVWWDPHLFELDKEAPSGIEATEALLEEDTAGPRSIAAFEEWKRQRARSTLEGARASVEVVVAGKLEPVLATGTIPLEATQAPRTGRPGGRRFGELVHACLASCALDASRVQLQAAIGVLSRVLGASEHEARAAVDAVESALAHPLVSAARKAKDVRREATIVHRLPDGRVVEGNIDLAYEVESGWVVVEFKTDDPAAAEGDESVSVLGQYEAQAQAYVEAIGQATGRPARGFILRV
ncbi:MAG: UvrD-helicase domain-containing protein [Myxococcaceae bacterium]